MQHAGGHQAESYSIPDHARSSAVDDPDNRFSSFYSHRLSHHQLSHPQVEGMKEGGSDGVNSQNLQIENNTDCVMLPLNITLTRMLTRTSH